MQGFAREKMLAVGLMAAVGFSVLPAGAVQVVEDLDDGIPVTLETVIDADKSQYGDPFRGVVSDDLEYKGQLLPKGTTLTGQVVQFQRKSYRLDFPAWVEVGIDSATLPGGQVIAFSKDPDSKIYSPKAKNIGDTFKSQLPLWMVSAGTSIPLRVATDLNGGVVTAISTGARVVTGVILELVKSPAKVAKNPPRFQSTPGKIGYGALRGIGVVSAYRMARLYPEPHLVPGDQIELRIDEENLQRMFDARDQVVKSAAEN